MKLAGKTLYWHAQDPWWGGAGFRFQDLDGQEIVAARRQPLRTTTWQDIAVDDQLLPEPDAIVASQLGCTIWELVALAVMRYHPIAR